MASNIGIDIGGVIIERIASESPMWNDFVNVPEIEGAIDAVRDVHAATGGRVRIVSQAGEWSEGRIREWLDANNFWERTGLQPSDVHFVRTNEEKPTVAKALDLTHFVDDRLDVLHLMPDSMVLHHLGDDHAGAGRIALDAIPARNWRELRRTLAVDLAKKNPGRAPIPMRGGVEVRAFVNQQDQLALMAADRVLNRAHLAVLENGRWSAKQAIDAQHFAVPLGWNELGAEGWGMANTIAAGRDLSSRELGRLASGADVALDAGPELTQPIGR